MKSGKPRPAVLSLVLLVLAGVESPAQELVISTGTSFGGPGPLVVLGDLAHDLASPAPFYIAPELPHLINPHGLSLLSRARTSASTSSIFQADRSPVTSIRMERATRIVDWVRLH